MRLSLRALVLALAVLAAPRALGVEIYSLYGEGCTRKTGAVIQVDDDAASILDLDGTISTVPLAGVQLVARYDILENPFPRIPSGKGAQSLLEVTSESSEGTFDAYATNFFEDLVLFLDDQGKIRVVEWSEIVAIKRVGVGKAKTAAALPARGVRLVSPPGRADCPAVESGAGAERGGKLREERVATQVMADKIKLDSSWARMRDGYRDLESLRERTLFYARPLMFDDKTRLGLTAVQTDRYDVYPLTNFGFDSLPLYLEFGGGDAYRFQSSTSIGVRSWTSVPQVRPMGALRSEFKSHLLHGTFVGNLSGFPAGKPIFASQWDSERQLRSPERARKEPWADTSFNHLTLLGVDFGRWSVSYGYYFPTFALGEGGEFREILATRASPVYRLGFVLPTSRVELFAFETVQRGEGPKHETGPDANQLDLNSRVLRYYSDRFVPEDVRLSSTTLRVHGDATLTQELFVFADVALTKISYSETAFVTTVQPAGAWTTSKLRQRHVGARAGVRMDLGKWVALAAEASAERAETEGGFKAGAGEADRKGADQILTYVATMELLL